MQLPPKPASLPENATFGQRIEYALWDKRHPDFEAPDSYIRYWLPENYQVRQWRGGGGGGGRRCWKGGARKGTTQAHPPPPLPPSQVVLAILGLYTGTAIYFSSKSSAAKVNKIRDMPAPGKPDFHTRELGGGDDHGGGRE